MSGDSSEEKDLPPSAKKLQDARRKGQIAKGQELVSAAGAVAAIAYLWARSGSIATQWREALTLSTQIQGEPFDVALRQLLSALGSLTGRTVVPLLAVTVAAGVLANVAINRGFVFSLQPMMPQLEHLNPFSGLKRMFGMRNWIELAKTFVKALLLGSALLFVVLGTLNTLVRLPVCGTGCIGYVFGSMATLLLAIGAGFLLAAGLADLLLQRWLFLRDMKMSKSEAKREHQETEGNPQVRGAHRRHRLESAEEPQLGIGQATIMIVGSEAAAGLRYIVGQTNVPLLVCRAKGDPAEALRVEAASRGIPVIDDGQLARALTRKIKLGAGVPSQYFERVAKAFYAAGLAG